MNDKVHIVLASDANYLPGLEVTKASMIVSCADPSRLAFHVFDGDSLSSCAVSGLPEWNGSRMAYLRLWLPTLLPNLDRVIYSDVDTVWHRDVCELWDRTHEPSNSNAVEPSLWWVRDFRSMKEASRGWIEAAGADGEQPFDWNRYGCSGVCVMNLRKMREMNFTERALALYAKHGVPKFPDQDVLNVLFNHDSELLPSVWNAMGDCSNLPSDGERCVYHLTGVGRHFHDETPPRYPPQYLFWWREREGMKHRKFRSLGVWALGLLWPLHGMAGILPLKLRERIVRQWFFAKELTK